MSTQNNSIKPFKLTIDLRLKHGITDAPQSRRHEEEMRLVRMRSPDQQPGQQPRMYHRSQRDDNLPSYVFHRRTEQYTASGVHHAETDHHVAQRRDAEGAGDIGLRELGTYERLLHAYVHGEDHQQLLVGFLHLVRGGGEELNRCHFVRTVASSFFTVSGMEMRV